MRELPRLPIIEALPELRAALGTRGAAVLEAPAGAGKSTVVPIALLDEPWLEGGRILVLEPRRVAARAIAERMADLLGERCGATVGYRTRLESRVGPGTRIEVVTEGILTRRLQRDPALEDVALVVFDEFHERNLQADLGLALCLEVRRHLRESLRLLVMSATLDGEAVARLLDDATRVRSPGRMHPVEVEWAPPPQVPGRTMRIEAPMVAATLRAVAVHPGDALLFLPGAAEIRRVAADLASALPESEWAILPLYGELGAAEQDAALQPDPRGRRKVVIATNLAETSLTIDGVRVVVDSGLERRQRFDPSSGMGRLETTRISRASAEQRRGRAGRTAPGVCIRLWSEAMHDALLPQAPPEILEADLAPLALELACWGESPESLHWLDPPPRATVAQAREGYRRRDLAPRDLRDTLAWPGFQALARRHWRMGAAELAGSASRTLFMRRARRYVPEVTAADVVPAPAGVRAQAVDRDGSLVDDFRISGLGPVLAVRNAPSPAATSSLAIAEHVTERLLATVTAG